MLKHTDEFSEIKSNYLIRHYIKPGITGWAQINGFRGETKTREDIINRVEHDIWYIENWTFFLDIKIIVKTITNALKGEDKAY
jgi:lipopolysaccharide/colanic/teichoic acid biosynthesis glycosyltransferase